MHPSFLYIVCNPLISWRCLLISDFFFSNQPLWLTHHKRVTSPTRPPIEIFTPNIKYIYIGSIFTQLYEFQEKIWAIHMRDNVRCYWEQVEEQIENLRNKWRTPKIQHRFTLLKRPPKKKTGVSIKRMLILHWLRRISIPNCGHRLFGAFG